MFTRSVPALRTVTAAMTTAIAMVLLLTGNARPAFGQDSDRMSTTRHYVEGGREGGKPASVSHDRYDPLDTEGTRTASTAAPAGSAKLSGGPMRSAWHDFWIFHVDVVLFGDDDRDGYFYGIDLLFDADTIYEFADVYAVLYLSFEGGPWNEYAVTQDFRIYGATSDDEFVVVTELEAGYPRGSYDILIELFDAYDGAFLASFGPADTSALAYLPLEDFRRDDPRGGHHHHHRGGGAAGLPLLMALALAVAVRHRRAGAAGRRLRDQVAAGRALPRAVRITLRPQADRESKYAYSAGTTSSETMEENVSPPMMARAIGK